MKLNELIKVLYPEEEVTFEILESTYPTQIVAKNILEKYPKASNYEVISLVAGTSYTENNIIPVLYVKVSRGVTNEK